MKIRQTDLDGHTNKVFIHPPTFEKLKHIKNMWFSLHLSTYDLGLHETRRFPQFFTIKESQ